MDRISDGSWTPSHRVKTAGRKVGDVMTADVRTVKENSRLDEIVHIMERHQINRVLVVRDDKLVGKCARRPDA